MLRKFISIILILLFLFYSAGICLVFHFIRYTVREEIEEEIKRGLEESDLSVITIYDTDREGIDWIRPGKEFRYKGEMYDVVKTRTTDHKKYLYCINDTREKQLVDDFKNHFKRRKKTEGKVKRLFTKIYFCQKTSFGCQIFSSDIFFNSMVDFYEPINIKVPLPPPKLIS